MYGLRSLDLCVIYFPVFHRAAVMSLPRSMTVNPDFGFTRDSKGYIDFFIDGKANMGIELTRDGDKLRIHSDRFEAAGLYAPLQLSSWAVVDFRKNIPQSKTVRENPSCLFVCFDADFAYATLIQAGRTKENVAMHYVDGPSHAGGKRLRVAADAAGESDYERAPHQHDRMHRSLSRDPIKTRQAAEEEVEDSEGEGDDCDGEEGDNNVRPGHRSPPTPVPPRALSFIALRSMPTAAMLERRSGLKATIASLASTIITNPKRIIAERSRANNKASELYKADGAAFRPRIPPLQHLQLLCGDVDPIIRKLAMLSCAAVFRDVAPGYCLRLPTAVELSALVGRDVRLRAFEVTLLTSYQRLIDYLEVTVTCGEAAGSRLHIASSGGRRGGGGDDASAAASGGRAAAYRGDGGGWKAQKMTEKRQRVTLGDSAAAYDANDETLHSLGLTALQVRGERVHALSALARRAASPYTPSSVHGRARRVTLALQLPRSRHGLPRRARCHRCRRQGCWDRVRGPPRPLLWRRQR